MNAVGNETLIPAREARERLPHAARDLHALLQGRFSCRAFLPESVPDEVVDAVLATAQHTASWSNMQPWKIWLTSGEETRRLREALLEHARQSSGSAPDVAWPREYTGVQRDRRRATGFQLYGALGIGRDEAERRREQALENYRLFGAPNFLLVTTPEELGAYGVLDCGSWVANFLAAARAHGVDTIAQAAVAHHSQFMRRWFAVPADRLVVCGISFGYADMGHPVNSYRVPRAPLNEVVVRHRSSEAR
jgi:nitroreductase